MIPVKLHNLKIFAVPLKNCYRHHLPVPASWQNWEAKCMFCLPSSLMFAGHSGAFSDNTQRLGYLLLLTAIAKIIILFSFFYPSRRVRRSRFVFARSLSDVG